VLEAALGQLDRRALEGEILVRPDGVGATHELIEFCRDTGHQLLGQVDLDERVREAIAAVPDSAWQRRSAQTAQSASTPRCAS